MRADLALVGFGNVGRRFAALLRERHSALLEHGLECRIVGIATRAHGATYSPEGVDPGTAVGVMSAGGRFSRQPPAEGVAHIIGELSRSDAPIRVVIETTTLNIIDGQPAIAHVEGAIKAGCHVITANKGPAAFAYRRLRTMAEAAGVSFLFEGAVMDGVPVFNLARDAMPVLTFQGFRGVINSTTNYILSALEDGEAFAPALARMQAQGIAEADATLDLQGWDAAAKTAALANVLMGAELTPHAVSRRGVGPEMAARARQARLEGRRLRLVASARRLTADSVGAAVGPMELPEDDLLARLRGTANAIIFETDLLGEVAVHQLGGGLTMTAYALVSDLVTIGRRAHGVPDSAAPARTRR